MTTNSNGPSTSPASAVVGNGGTKLWNRNTLPRTPIERFFSWALRAIVVAVLAFLIVPILIIILESFNGVNYLAFPLKGFSTQHYESFFADDSWMSSMALSFRIALLSAFIATLLGTMAAWALARTKARGKALVYALLYSPVVIPVIVLAMGYYFFFSKLHLIGNWMAIAAAYAVLGIPFVLVAVSSALEQFDKESENAARTLGAGPIRTLWFVTIPQLTSAIFAGAIFAFVVAFDEAIIILFIAGGGGITFPRKLWDSIRFDLNPTLAVAGTLLIAIVVGLYMVAELIKLLRERRE